MDPTAWVGIAGIGGTLLASVLAPILSERMRRRSSRLDRLHEQRLTAYADMLQVTARFADNAMTWSAIPNADLKETEDGVLDALVSRIRVVGSDDVHRRFGELASQLHRFNRELYDAQAYHVALREAGTVDDQKSIGQRMSLGSIADGIVKSHGDLEAIVRKEVKR